VQIIKIIEEVFNKPPVPFDPARSSLKAWAMYCLRGRGFKVIYAEKGDFAIETRSGEKAYFKVTENAADVDNSVSWIVRDPSSNSIRVTTPSA
jgi:hypothetical protein